MNDELLQSVNITIKSQTELIGKGCMDQTLKKATINYKFILTTILMSLMKTLPIHQT